MKSLIKKYKDRLLISFGITYLSHSIIPYAIEVVTNDETSTMSFLKYLNPIMLIKYYKNNILISLVILASLLLFVLLSTQHDNEIAIVHDDVGRFATDEEVSDGFTKIQL